MSNPIIVYGSPSEKWEEVQKIQDKDFIYIQSNGSRWAGQMPGDIDELLETLDKHPLDISRFEMTDNPCEGVYNYDYPRKSNKQFIDGDRLYKVDGVVRFSGNFTNISHCFSIDTNHKPTINRLKKSIENNLKLQKVVA